MLIKCCTAQLVLSNLQPPKHNASNQCPACLPTDDYSKLLDHIGTLDEDKDYTLALASSFDVVIGAGRPQL